MKTKSNNPALVLRCYTKTEYGYGHVMFYPMVKQPDGKIEGIGCGDEFGKWFVRDLIVSDQIDDHNGSSGRDYAWSVYYESHRVELRDAQGMVKTLTAIDRKAEQLREQFGYCENYGQYVCRIANCLDAVAIVFDSERYEGELHEMAPGHAIERINREVEKVSRKLRGEPTIEEAAQQQTETVAA